MIIEMDNGESWSTKDPAHADLAPLTKTKTTAKVKPSKFKRKHAAYVLVVRDPDMCNQYTIDGDVHTIDIDLGASFTGRPESEKQAVSWAKNIRQWLDPVPITSPVYAATIRQVHAVVTDFPKAAAVVNAYIVKRES